jgi:hypothetical protein
VGRSSQVAGGGMRKQAAFPLDNQYRISGCPSAHQQTLSLPRRAGRGGIDNSSLRCSRHRVALKPTERPTMQASSARYRRFLGTYLAPQRTHLALNSSLPNHGLLTQHKAHCSQMARRGRLCHDQPERRNRLVDHGARKYSRDGLFPCTDNTIKGCARPPVACSLRMPT